MSIRSRNWLKLTAVVAPAFVLGLFFAGLLDFPRPGMAQERAQHTPIVKVDAPRIPAARPLVDLSDAYAAVAEAVRPSVVYIVSERPMTADDQEQPDITDQLPPQFRQLLPRNQQRGQQAPQQQQPPIERGSGSGFIVSSDGYILTNNHVIEGSSKVTVRLLDGREFTATIVGSDKDTDVGLIKINATGLTPAALGSSEASRVGEWVLAIGNPLGADLTFTVTQGIISAKGRGNLSLEGTQGGTNIQDFIQTDAVINRGNSGGPLVNARGEVIGINSAIASGTGYYTGYAFAVPIDLARKVMDQLVAHGHVDRAGMQIEVKDADRDDAEYLGLPSIAGVVVRGFTPADAPETSAAAKGGIKAGDVIEAIDGQPIKYVSQLQQDVGFRHPGDVVKVDVVRADGKHTFNVKLVSLNGPTAADEVGAATPGKTGDDVSSSKAMLGMVLTPLTPTTAMQYGFPATTKGMVVQSVVEDSPASDKGICSVEAAMQQECGAPIVLLSIEGKPVQSDADVRAALKDARHGIVAVEYGIGSKDRKMTTLSDRIRLR